MLSLRSTVWTCCSSVSWCVQVFEKYDMYGVGRMQYELMLDPGYEFPSNTSRIPNDDKARERPQASLCVTPICKTC